MTAIATVIPLAELHCHIEGAAPTDLVRELAHRNGVEIGHLIDQAQGYVWTDFKDFLRVYDEIASLFTRPEDYENLAYAYAMELKGHGAIYSEIFASTDHAERAGVAPLTYLEALARGHERAERETGIVSRIVPIGVRHFGARSINRAADLAIEAAKANARITGFGIGGAEDAGSLLDAKPAFQKCAAAGLGLTAHAGEWTGPRTVRDALELGVTRIGHGIRAVEDPKLIQELAARGVTLEVCPLSNQALGASAIGVENPVNVLHGAGVALSANADDPPHFHTHIAKDYAAMVERIGGDELAITAGLTRNALNAAFVDEATRQQLLEKLDAALASVSAELH